MTAVLGVVVAVGFHPGARFYAGVSVFVVLLLVLIVAVVRFTRGLVKRRATTPVDAAPTSRASEPPGADETE